MVDGFLVYTYPFVYHFFCISHIYQFQRGCDIKPLKCSDKNEISKQTNQKARKNKIIGNWKKLDLQEETFTLFDS